MLRTFCSSKPPSVHTMPTQFHGRTQKFSEVSTMQPVHAVPTLEAVWASQLYYYYPYPQAHPKLFFAYRT